MSNSIMYGYYSYQQRVAGSMLTGNHTTGAAVYRSADTTDEVICTEVTSQPKQTVGWDDMFYMGRVDGHIREAGWQEQPALKKENLISDSNVYWVHGLSPRTESCERKCDCGAVKARTPHAGWCSTQ